VDRPLERDHLGEDIPVWLHAGSNLLLDFHGDPYAADLVIFSDGNHHMALGEALGLFQQRTPQLKGLFYATTPPDPILSLLRYRKLRLGNFVLSAVPHLFMGPPHVLDLLVAEGRMASHQPFVRNQGNALLVKKGNPKGIRKVSDLKRKGITVFLSNPTSEKASHRSYRDTLVNLSGDAQIEKRLAIQYGERIHHREAPEAVRGGHADAAVLFYHLALYCTRRFADDFEMVPLGGSIEKPEPFEGNRIGHTHLGLIGDGGKFGRAFIDFLMTADAKAIYRHHGLLPIR
jgi:hypothetical protein